MAKYTIELPDDLNSEEQKHTGGFIKMNSSLDKARADLQATLAGGKQPEVCESEQEAREMLRRTQELLAAQSQPGAKKAAKKSK
jgi:hypothetical protein